MPITINSENCFNPINSVSLVQSRDALKHYREKFDLALRLTLDVPIVLDANVLLNYYEISLSDKQTVFSFLRKYRSRILITKRVQDEFLRNRQSAIREFLESLESIKESFDQKIVRSINSGFSDFLSSRILSKDLSGIHAKIQEIHLNVQRMITANEGIAKDLVDSIAGIRARFSELPYSDDLLDFLAGLPVVDPLTPKEVEFVIAQYDLLAKDYSTAREGQKTRLTFPGCNEKKEKETYGDLLIYYEILKYMSEKTTDAIFLTNDVTKGDWLMLDRNPYVHYIEQTYRISGHSLFILHAEKIIPDVSFERIYATSPDFQAIENPFHISFLQAVEAVYNDLLGDIRYSGASLSIRPIASGLEKDDFPDFDIIITLPDSQLVGVKVIYRPRLKLKGFLRNYRKRLRQTERSIESGEVSSALIYCIFPSPKVKIPNELRDGMAKSNILVTVGWCDVANVGPVHRLTEAFH